MIVYGSTQCFVREYQCEDFAFCYYIQVELLYLSDLLSKSKYLVWRYGQFVNSNLYEEFCHAQICCQISTDADSFSFQMYIVGYDSDHLHQSRVVWVIILVQFWIFTIHAKCKLQQIIRSDMRSASRRSIVPRSATNPLPPRIYLAISRSVYLPE